MMKMSSLDNAMEMLIVAQNVIEEQKEKIKLLKSKTRKMKSKIVTLERKLIESKQVKVEAFPKKEMGTQTGDPDHFHAETSDDKISSTVPLCDLVKKLELSAQSSEIKIRSKEPCLHPSTSRSKISTQTNKFPNKQYPAQPSDELTRSKDSLQLLKNIDTINLNFSGNSSKDFVTKNNVKRDLVNKDTFHPSGVDRNFDLQTFLGGDEESSDLPSFDESLSKREDILPNPFLVSAIETPTEEKIFFRSESATPFEDIDPSELLVDSNSREYADSGKNNAQMKHSANDHKTESCDILNEYSQGNYNMSNFELLDNLSESQMENIGLFNDRELNSSLDLSDISNLNRPTLDKTNLDFGSSTLSMESSSTDDLPLSSLKKTKSSKANTKVSKKSRNNAKKNKKSANANANMKLGYSGYSANPTPAASNILNVRSIFSEQDSTEEIIHSESRRETSQAQYNDRDQADELIRIVEEDRMELFATDDKDTFIISLNSDMDPDRLKQLLSDGTLSIHVDDGEKNAIFCNDINRTVDNASFLPIQCTKDDNIILNNALIEGSQTNDILIFVEDATFDNDCETVQSGSITLERDQQLEEVIDDNNKDNSIDTSAAQVDREVETSKERSVKDPVQKKIFTCEKCKKIFMKRDNYTSHLSTHNLRKKKHVCETCGDGFSWRSSLVRHTAAKHHPPTQCTLCDVLLAHPSKVNEHMKNVHFKEKTHLCTYPDCGRKFFKKYNLTLHIRSHTKEQLYACSFCDSTFGHNCHKKRHERVHFSLPSKCRRVARIKPPSLSDDSKNINNNVPSV